jgi:amidase
LEINDLGLVGLTTAIRSGAVSPSEVMAATLDRVTQVNPGLNAVVSLLDADRLMAQAKAAEGHRGGPLHGVPWAVKDLVATAGLRTTWGSPIHADHLPAKDDLLAARLRAAGAIFIGKTNVPEWGQGSHSYNPVFGVTRNPYDTARSAGGSSGGAAAALAARLVAGADGSDMMGSLRNPAAFCNVYGFRPTWGLIPQDALGDTFLATLATDGPMARDIDDLALILRVMAGDNPGTPFGRGDFTGIEQVDLRGKRIGWLGDWGGAYPMEPGILDLCEKGLQVFYDMGAIIEPLPPPFSAPALWEAWTTLRSFLTAGGKRALWENLATRAQLKPETLWEIEQGRAVTGEALYKASETRSRWYARAARLFETYDALILPSAQVWPFPAAWDWPKAINDQRMDSYHRWMEVVIPASLAGLPALALPCGIGPDGLPMGMQMIGPTGSDARLLGMGQAYHRATDWPRRAPPPLPG